MKENNRTVHESNQSSTQQDKRVKPFPEVSEEIKELAQQQPTIQPKDIDEIEY